MCTCMMHVHDCSSAGHTLHELSDVAHYKNIGREVER